MPTIAPAGKAVTETSLIERARKALSDCNWTIGECAAEWTRRFAKGRTDADFGEIVGISQQRVSECRRIFDRFSDYRLSVNVKWTHLVTALPWDEDADECLQWADEMQATVAEMKAWRRAQRGEDLSEPTDETPKPPDGPGGGKPEGRRAATSAASGTEGQSRPSSEDRRPRGASSRRDKGVAPGGAQAEPNHRAPAHANGNGAAAGREPNGADTGGACGPASAPPVLPTGIKQQSNADQTPQPSGQQSLFGDQTGDALSQIWEILEAWSGSATKEDRERMAEGLAEMKAEFSEPKPDEPSPPPDTTEALQAVRSVVDRWKAEDEIDAATFAQSLHNVANSIHGGVIGESPGPELAMDYQEVVDGRAWPEIESEFVGEWNACEGVAKSSYSVMPDKLRRTFQERVREDGWLQRAREAMAKFPLKNGAKIHLRKFLEQTTVDEILGGVHDFDPSRTERRKSTSEHNRESMQKLFDRFGEPGQGSGLTFEPLGAAG